MIPLKLETLIERKLDEADRTAAETKVRYSLDEVHERVLAKLHEQEDDHITLFNPALEATK